MKEIRIENKLIDNKLNLVKQIESKIKIILDNKNY